MNESNLNRMIREHKARIIWFLVFLILAVFVTALVFGTLKRSVQAQTYTKRVFACSYAQEGAEPVAHKHNDDCYENGELICTLPERELHIHGDECYAEEKVLVCTLEEGEGHVHTDACYTEEPVLVCGLEESDGHVHSVENGCYTRVQGDLICTDEDPEHVHTDECYAWEEVLTCEIPEGEGAHHHSEECYETQRVLSCGKEEGEGAHTHDDTCYEIQKVLICDKEEVKTEHVHTVDCFQVTDMSPEEIHALHMSELPESDPDADVESPDVWESRFASVPLSGEWDRDLLKIAETQLGYTESQRNFDAVLNEDGDGYTLKGWTRYGAWYGIPYGDWCAMFISFCLNYADIPESAVPYDCATTTWIDSLSARGMYAPAGSYDPKPGDLIFFDWEGDGLSDHVGIVWAVNPGSITTIEGNHTISVELFDYDLSDGHIQGYGILPENPALAVTDSEENVSDDNENQDETEGGTASAAGASDGDDASNNSNNNVDTENTEKTELDPETLAKMPPFSYSERVAGIRVSIEADAGAFPEGTTVEIKAIEDDGLAEQVAPVVNGKVVQVQAVDITFYDAEGNEIEPRIPIRVTMRPNTETDEANGVEVVHVDNEGNVNAVTPDEGITQPDKGAAFDADSFSPYVLVYVVKFEYEVNGKTYESELAGGENLSLSNLLVQLGVCEQEEISEFVSKIDTVTASDPEALSVAQTEGDWTIRPLKDSEEALALAIEMKDGAKFSVAVQATGKTEVTSEDNNTVITAVNDLYLPEGAAAESKVLTEEQGADAIAAVEKAVEQEAAEPAADDTAESAESAEPAEPAEPEENTVSQVVYQVYSISLENVEYSEYEDGFQVSLTLPQGIAGKDFEVYHIDDNGEAQKLEIETDAHNLTEETQLVSTVSFVTPSFSDFVIRYTVDFHYKVNGNFYEFSFTGGSFVSLEKLLELLQIPYAPEPELKPVSAAAEPAMAEGESGGENSAMGDEFADTTNLTSDTNADEESPVMSESAGDAAETEANETRVVYNDLSGIGVSETTKNFVARIDSVSFTTPELIWVGKVEADTTVGAIKEANSLTPKYSAELTEEQIAEIDAQTFTAGDWALISLKPFQTEESLTIVMKDGRVFTIRVTDAQNAWKVTVNLYSYDGVTPATPDDMSVLNGKSHAILAVFTNKSDGSVAGYRLGAVDFNSIGGETSAEITMDLTSFKKVIDQTHWWQESGEIVNYNSDSHDISFRMYEGDNVAVSNWQYQGYGNIISYPDSVSGFEFLPGSEGCSIDTQSGKTVLNLKRAYDKQYNVRLKVDTAGLTITDSDEYYVLITAKHQTGGDTYSWIREISIPDDATCVDIPINTWYSSDNKVIPNEKFTGNETIVLDLFTPQCDGNGAKTGFSDISNFRSNQTKLHIEDGSSVNTYNVYYHNMYNTGSQGRETVNDDTNKIENIYDVIEFHAPGGSISKAYIDSFLTDALDFGYYTLDFQGGQADFEGTVGAAKVTATTNLDIYGYSGNNATIDRLEILKVYKENGIEVKNAPVTIELRGAKDTSKSGYTGDDGTVRFIFDDLPSGNYKIYEVLKDNSENEYRLGANEVLSRGGITATFSATEVQFVNNRNFLYFGTIPNWDEETIRGIFGKLARDGLAATILTDDLDTKDRLDNANKKDKDSDIDAEGNREFQVYVRMNDGTGGYKKYNIESDFEKLKALSNILAEAESSKTVRVINLKASDTSAQPLVLEDDGRFIVINVTMDKDVFYPKIKLGNETLNWDFDASGKNYAGRVLFNFRDTDGEPYDGYINFKNEGAGIVLAPEATAGEITAAFGGTYITKAVDRSGGELHYSSPTQQTLNVIIQNEKGANPDKGSLELKKSFVDNSITDTKTCFMFEVSLRNDDMTLIAGKSFPAEGLKSGDKVLFNDSGDSAVATVLVRANNTVIIRDLPAGTTYTVKEIPTVESQYYYQKSIEPENGAGTILAGQIEHVTVVNDRTRLFVEKKVSPAGKNPDKEFAFKVVLNARTGGELAPNYTFKKGSTVISSGISYNRSADNKTATITGILLKENEIFSIEDLPVGTGYTITETDYSVDGYTSSIQEGGVTGTISSDHETKVTVTNTYGNPKSFGLNIRKIDNEDKLITEKPATFTLVKINKDNAGTIEPIGDPLPAETEDGVASFENLEVGYYEVREIAAPKGYVLSGDPVFYVEVSDTGAVNLLIKGEGAPSNWTVKNTVPAGNVKTFSYDAKTGLATVTVVNQKGVELPNSGGPGTALYGLLGGLMVVTAGAVLTLRRKKKNKA